MEPRQRKRVTGHVHRSHFLSLCFLLSLPLSSFDLSISTLYPLLHPLIKHVHTLHFNQVYPLLPLQFPSIPHTLFPFLLYLFSLLFKTHQFHLVLGFMCMFLGPSITQNMGSFSETMSLNKKKKRLVLPQQPSIPHILRQPWNFMIPSPVQDWILAGSILACMQSQLLEFICATVLSC